jgi:hypothetical protein
MKTLVPDNPVVGIKWLCIAALASVIIWQLPFGDKILYPFSIFATFYHEMGHGVAAHLVGYTFMFITIYSDGSGQATYGFTKDTETAGRMAFVAISGPLAPCLVGSLLMCLSVAPVRISRVALGSFGAFLIVSSLLLVRGTFFGMVMIPLMGVFILYISARAYNHVVSFVVQFMGLQACISTYNDISYFFTYQVNFGSIVSLSDTGTLQRYLLLPYWLWAMLIIGISATFLLSSLYLIVRTSFIQTKKDDDEWSP